MLRDNLNDYFLKMKHFYTQQTETNMTNAEIKFMEMTSNALERIADQLEIANRLKALELKSKRDADLSPETVDDVLMGSYC